MGTHSEQIFDAVIEGGGHCRKRPLAIDLPPARLSRRLGLGPSDEALGLDNIGRHLPSGFGAALGLPVALLHLALAIHLDAFEEAGGQLGEIIGPCRDVQPNGVGILANDDGEHQERTSGLCGFQLGIAAEAALESACDAFHGAHLRSQNIPSPQVRSAAPATLPMPISTTPWPGARPMLPSGRMNLVLPRGNSTVSARCMWSCHHP